MARLPLLAVALLLPSCSGTSGPRDDLDVFVARFGKPDADESSEDEKPRPLIVTRTLTYKTGETELTRKTEGVRAVYRLDDTDHTWHLFGFQDALSLKPIEPAEVVKRLASRDKQKDTSASKLQR